MRKMCGLGETNVSSDGCGGCAFQNQTSYC